MEFINIRFFTLKGGLATQGSGTRDRCLFKVTSILTKACLTVHCCTASGRERNHAMNEQNRRGFLFSGWLDWIHNVSWVFQNFTNYSKFPNISKIVVHCIASYMFNYLKNYICLNNNNKSGSVSQKTHNTFIIKLFVKIIAVYFDNHTEHKIVVWRQREKVFER